MAISETKEREDGKSVMQHLPGYEMKPLMRKGSDKGGGGLCLYYRSNLTAHLWIPKTCSKYDYVSKERQWLLIKGLTEKLAFLHVYIACQTNRSDSYLQWNNDLFSLLTEETHVLRSQGFSILALCDFNTRVGRLKGMEENLPDVNNNYPMFLNFIESSNLVIVNTLPVSRGLFTRFMDNSELSGSKSVLDYCLRDADSVNTVSSFIIDSNARFKCGSDHALLEATIYFGTKISLHWNISEALRFNFNENTNFQEYQNKLESLSSTINLDEYSKMSTSDMLHHLSKSLIDSGMLTFGLKTKKIKKGRRQPKHILELLREKEHTCIKLKEAHGFGDKVEIDSQTAELINIKQNIKDQIQKHKLKKRHRIRSIVLKKDPSRKKFWSFLKNQMKAAGNISACYDNEGKVVFGQEDIEEVVIGHFQKTFNGQRTPVYNTEANDQDIIDEVIHEKNENLEPQNNVPENKYEADVCAPITMTELEELICLLPNQKACGLDNIPNEFLKNSTFKFKCYLLSFYNKIIDEGNVPASLNMGKCCLIWKVSFTSVLDYKENKKGLS